jgi:hypothetical protein
MSINTMKTLPLASLLFFCCTHLFASETNRLFVTINDGGENVSDYKNGTDEHLPAEQFPAGNWGQATNGIQVSLRFDKPDYTNGEPITATILVRNISSQRMPYRKFYVSGRDGPVRFDVSSASNRHVEGMPVGENCSIMGADIRAGGQNKFVERFDKEFYLTNGTYFVQAYVDTGFLRVCAESAKVPITITDVSK